MSGVAARSILGLAADFLILAELIVLIIFHVLLVVIGLA
jgi:hypothetical protein